MNCFRCNKPLSAGMSGYCGLKCYMAGPVYMTPGNAALIGAVMDDERKKANPYWNQ